MYLKNKTCLQDNYYKIYKDHRMIPLNFVIVSDIYTSKREGLFQSHLGVFLLCNITFLLVHTWALDPSGYIVILLNESFGVDFSSTFFESGLALLKVGCVVFGSDDGDEDDEGGYDTNENALDLK